MCCAHICPRITINASSYCVLLYVCSHTAVRVRILLYKCPHTAIYAGARDASREGHNCRHYSGRHRYIHVYTYIYVDSVTPLGRATIVGTIVAGTGIYIHVYV